MASLAEVLEKLKARARPDQVAGMARYGMTADRRLGVSVPDMRKLAKEIVKRAAFALIACLAWHDKEAKDEEFIKLFPVIRRGATDERNFVKKAVNWALRHIGKRNSNLNRTAIKAAREIQRIDSRAARWIASNAIRELQSEAVQSRLRR